MFALAKEGNSLLGDRGQFPTDVSLGPGGGGTYGLPSGTVHGFRQTHPLLPNIDGLIQPGTASSDVARGMLDAYTDKNIRQANLNQSMEPVNASYGVNKREDWIPNHSLPYFETVLYRNLAVARNVGIDTTSTSGASTRLRQEFSYKQQNVAMFNFDMKYSPRGREWGAYRSFTECLSPLVTTCGVQINVIPDYAKNKVSELELEFHIKGFASQVVNTWASWSDSTIKERLASGSTSVLHGDHVGYLVNRYRNRDDWTQLFSGTVGEHTDMINHYHWSLVPHISPTGRLPPFCLYNNLEIDTPAAISVAAAAATDVSSDSGSDYGMDEQRDMSVSRLPFASRGIYDNGGDGMEQDFDTDDTSMFDSDGANARAIEHDFDLMGTPGHWDVPYKSDMYQGAYWYSGVIRDAVANNGGSAMGQALVDITRQMIFPNNNGDDWHEKYSLSSRVSMILKPRRVA